MTNEIEKTFFDTFGIEERCEFDKYCDDCKTCGCYHYPRITNNILLKLICIVLNTFQTFEVCRIIDIDSLKEKILKLSILAKDEVYSEVRTLFEEVENEI